MLNRASGMLVFQMLHIYCHNAMEKGCSELSTLQEYLTAHFPTHTEHQHAF